MGRDPEPLRVKQLNGYLLHTPEYIYQPKIIEALRTLKEEKLVEHIGVSIYELCFLYKVFLHSSLIKNTIWQLNIVNPLCL